MSLLWEAIHLLRGKMDVHGSGLLAKHCNEEINGLEINGLGGWSTCPVLGWVSCDLSEVQSLIFHQICTLPPLLILASFDS